MNTTATVMPVDICAAVIVFNKY